MTNTKRFILPLSFAILGIALLLLSVTTRQSLAAGQLNEAALYQGNNNVPLAEFPMILDFEAGIPAAPPWFAYGDWGNGVTIDVQSATLEDSDPMALPGQVGDNTVLSTTVNVASWGGFGSALDPIQDWSNYDAVSFWYYGTNISTTHEFEIQTASGDDRRATFIDDFNGWRQIVLPFSTFGNGGEYDVSQVDNWVFVLDGTIGSFKMDNLQVVKLSSVLDFEAGIPAAPPWFAYGDWGNSVTIDVQSATLADSDPMALPGQVGDNTVLSTTVNVASWGGFGSALDPIADWSSMQGVSFWYYGTNISTTHEFEIQTASGDDRRATFVDDFDGWQLIVLPFSTFGNGGAYDVSQVDNWVFVLDGTVGAFKMDSLSTYGAPPIEPPPPPPAIELPLVADFEAGQPQGWFQYSGGGGSVSVEFGAIDGNGSVSATHALNGGWAGFGMEYPDDIKDWSNYDGVRLEIFGHNSGATYALEIQDKASGDAVERFHANFVDDFNGSRQVVLPFSSFYRGGHQEGNPPNDGLQTNAIAAWAMPLPATDATISVQHIELVNLDVLQDFEAGIPGDPPWFIYNGGGAAITQGLAIITDSNPMALPGQVGNNQALSITVDATTGWAGYGMKVDPGDWSEMDGVTFWYYGTELTATHQVEIQTGNVGNHRAPFSGNFDGWQQVTIPFSEFEGSPFDLTQVTNWVVVLDGVVGSFKFDGMSVYGDLGVIALKVGFESSSYQIEEGGTAEITVSLTTTSTENVTVTVNTADGSADSSDYTAITNQEVVIPAGQLNATFSIVTADDNEDEAGETVDLTLTNAAGIELAKSSAVLTIIDNDENATGGAKVEIIDNFESSLPLGKDGNDLDIGFVTWSDGGSIAITTTTEADAGIDTVPGSSSPNHVIKVTGSFSSWGGGFSHAFENEAVDTWTPMDWSNHSGIAFWYYGEGDGQAVWIDIAENRTEGSTTDDAERWTYGWSDDTAGWQFIQVPFSTLTRKDIGNSAPDDGWAGEEVHAWAFGIGGTGGAEEVRYIDDFGLLERVATVDDFTNPALPYIEIANQVAIGWVTWHDDGGSSIAITTTTPTNAGIEAVPGKDDSDTLLQLSSNVNSWGGFSHAFENEAQDTWVSQDWSTYEGICFWYYGTGSGTDVLIEISENRNPGSEVADAEIWSYTHDDTVAGWQFIQLPFTEFARKNINNGAPDDGWSGKEVHGWSFGTLGTGGPEVRYIDDYSLYGYQDPAAAPLSVQFGAVQYDVSEGDTISVSIELNKIATEPVTVTYRTGDSYAILDRDFKAVSGTIIIPAGQLSVTIAVETLEDSKFEATEIALLSIASAEGADLGFLKRTRVAIINDDTEDTDLIHDFEGWHPFDVAPGIEASIVELMTGTVDAIPGQDTYEQVLSVSGSQAETRAGAAQLGTTFVEPQDWSSHQGLSFWYYGSGSGDTVKVEVLDNAANSTATVTNTEWVEVWSQEFNGAAGTLPDSNVWSYELNDGFLNELSGWGNSELQYYSNSPDNAAMDGNGNLVITLNEMEDSGLHCHYGTCTHSSARLISENKVEFQYGEIEARIQVPTGPGGLWPAFWMLGTDIREVGWPQSGEIDIMEYVSRRPNEVFGTLHGPGHFGGSGYGNIYDFGSPVATDYHTFRIVWEPNHIEWYVDDIKFHEADNTDVNGEWVYNHPFYMILNLAVGGTFGGQVDAGMTYPQTMLVDYIRVKGAADSAERFEAPFVDNAIGWTKYTIPFSTFTRSADQPANAPDDGFGRDAVNGYGLILPESSSSFMIDQLRLEETVSDQEYDGVDDAVEDGAPNNGDGNNDGVPDKEQIGVASLPNAGDGNYTTIDAGDMPLLNVSTSTPVTLPTGTESLPYGVFNFAISVTVGGTAQVTLTLHDASADDIDTIWKQNSDGSWYQFSFNETTGVGAVINGTTVVLHLQDGGIGDADGVANGLIIDPVAPGRATQYKTYLPIIFR